MFLLLSCVQQLSGTLASVPVQRTFQSVTPHRLKQHYKLFLIEDGEELADRCSLTSLDGYSTIDQRDKDCKYKTGDGSVDLTEREPLKVQTTSPCVLGDRGTEDEIMMSP